MCHPQMGSHPELERFLFPQKSQQDAEKEKTEDRCSHKGISPEVWLGTHPVLCIISYVTEWKTGVAVESYIDPVLDF